MTAVKKTCARVGCGKQFVPHHPSRKFCTKQCSRRSWEGVPMPKPVPEWRTCALDECGRRFRPTNAQNLYHSRPCMWRAIYLRRRAHR